MDKGSLADVVAMVERVRKRGGHERAVMLLYNTLHRRVPATLFTTRMYSVGATATTTQISVRFPLKTKHFVLSALS
jgi:hypothetical protein